MQLTSLTSPPWSAGSAVGTVKQSETHKLTIGVPAELR
jgi:hypothetical protein